MDDENEQSSVSRSSGTAGGNGEIDNGGTGNDGAVYAQQHSTPTPDHATRLTPSQSQSSFLSQGELLLYSCTPRVLALLDIICIYI